MKKITLCTNSLNLLMLLRFLHIVATIEVNEKQSICNSNNLYFKSVSKKKKKTGALNHG